MPKAPSQRGLSSRSDDWGSSFSGKRPRPLSQALPGLPALPKGEPLAKPQALRVNRKLCRHAKGPNLEGAVAEGDWGSSGKRPRPLSQALPGLPALPKGEPLA